MQFPHCDGMCVIRTLQLRFVFRFEPGPLESRIPIPDLVNHLVLVVRIEGIVWSDLVLGDSKNANPDSGRLDDNGVILIIGAILWIGVVNQV